MVSEVLQRAKVQAPGHTNGLEVTLYITSNPPAAHQTAPVEVARDEVVLGGGALVGQLGDGNLLTAIYPAFTDTRIWEARSKDHEYADEEILVAACIAIFVPSSTDYWIGRSAVSPIGRHTTVVCGVPCDYELVGGGALANWEDFGGPGNLLWASLPVSTYESGAGSGDQRVWFAAAKDHIDPSQARLTAFATGLSRSFLTDLGLEVRLFSISSERPVQHPIETVQIDSSSVGWRGVLVAGGATLEGHPPGSLLTGSYPDELSRFLPIPPGTRTTNDPVAPFQGWTGSGKDHGAEFANLSRITVSAIAIGCPGATVSPIDV